MAQRTNNSENTLAKNKTIVLTVPDFIAIVGFLISLGITLGMYVKTMEDVGSINTRVGSINTKFDSLNTRSAVSTEQIKNLQNSITEIKTKIK